MLYPEGEYENFFVCNYGVGGNVPGQPIYNTECTEDKAENKIKTQGIKINYCKICSERWLRRM